MNNYLKLVLLLVCLLKTVTATANNHFKSDYPCNDYEKVCLTPGDKKMKIIEGFEVERDCWEWGYKKICDYPSADNCARYQDCYLLGRRDCLLHDLAGNCVNWQKEFSCKKSQFIEQISEHLRTRSSEKPGGEGLLCEALPCMDGNCVDKSYQMDSEMMASIAKLSAIRLGKNDGYNFSIFKGQDLHCSKKMSDYSNCCSLSKPGSGWGAGLGAGCTKDEGFLAERRKKNLCVYVGKEQKKQMGVVTVTKHHFCCFANILDKIIQVQGKKQLGLNFGSGGSADCRGLTLDEIERIDWDKIDFSEFAAEVSKKVVIPNTNDLEERVKNASFDIRGFKEQKEGEIFPEFNSKDFSPGELDLEDMKMQGINRQFKLDDEQGGEQGGDIPDEESQ